MHIGRLLFSASFTIRPTTCARQGETLGLMIPFEQSREISVLMNSWSVLLNCLDLTAIGLHERETLLNNYGIETTLFHKTRTSLDTTKLFLTPLNLNTICLNSDRKLWPNKI